MCLRLIFDDTNAPGNQREIPRKNIEHGLKDIRASKKTTASVLALPPCLLSFEPLTPLISLF